MTFGEKIRALRKDLGLTQEEVAKRIKVNRRQYTRYEAEGGNPSMKILASLSEVLDVTTDFLIFGHDKKASKRAQIADSDIFELMQRIDNLQAPKRNKIKWAIRTLLDGENEIHSVHDSSTQKIAKSA